MRQPAPECTRDLLDVLIALQPQYVAPAVRRARGTQFTRKLAVQTQAKKQVVHTLEQVGRGIERDDAPLLEHRDALAQRLGFFQIVRREDDGVPSR